MTNRMQVLLAIVSGCDQVSAPKERRGAEGSARWVGRMRLSLTLNVTSRGAKPAWYKNLAMPISTTASALSEVHRHGFIHKEAWERNGLTPWTTCGE